MSDSVEYHITQYDLEQGALEIQYIEEYFGEFPRKKTATEIGHRFDEIVVKTKNKFYDMRGTLDHLRFEVVKYERNLADNAESKVYLSKKLVPETISRHRSKKAVVQRPV